MMSSVESEKDGGHRCFECDVCVVLLFSWYWSTCGSSECTSDCSAPHEQDLSIPNRPTQKPSDHKTSHAKRNPTHKAHNKKCFRRSGMIGTLRNFVGFFIFGY